MTVVGGGATYLGNAETYLGGTTVRLGTLDLFGSGALPASSTNDVNAVQTITFGGTITAGSTFALVFNGATTAPITYSSTTATLQSNIQAALSNLTTLGGTGNNTTLVSAGSPTSVNITFQNQLAGTVVPTMTAASSLTGTSPTVTVATLTAGVAPVTLYVSSGLQIDDAVVVNPNRLSATTNITDNGATIAFLGLDSVGTLASLTMGNITLASGQSNISSATFLAGDSNAITSNELLRAPGAERQLHRRRDRQHPAGDL